MNARERALDAQRKLNWFSNHENGIVWARSWRATEGLPLGMRYAELGAARLAALDFLHDPEEPLIGRLAVPELDPAENERAWEFIHASGVELPGQTGHAEPYYDDLFALGLDGLREKARGTPSFVRAAEGLSAMIERAAGQAAAEEVAAACRHIAHEPPATFREAIQLVWFVMTAIQIGDRAALVGPGRLDRRLIRFYEADLAAGRLTRGEALRMIETLYLFINASCPRGLAYAVMAGGGGVCNELTLLSLEALRKTRLVYPSVGVCWSFDTPDELKTLAVELIADGISNVAVFNDELIRRSMVRYGVPAEDASEYINSTCVEITPCGASNVYVASPYFSLCALLLDYLKEPEGAGYAAFRAGYLKRAGREIDRAAEEQNRVRRIRRERMRRPIQSLFTRDCIARGLDIEEGGARYNWVECSFVGLANLADSLTVIRREVFEQKNLTLPELRDVLERNFENAEALRQRFLNGSPKYGNGNQEADGEIPIITTYLAARCARQRMEPDDSHFIPGTFCWEMHQRLGAECGATPDGRRAGFPFADGAGPAQGREKEGPTAAVNSVCSWNHLPMLGGSAFNQRYTAAAVATPAARENLKQLIDIFIRFGGFETQVNILDAARLKAAQLHPEEHRDLVVRIGGYTDYFTGLSPAMQAEVIQRTQYEEL